MGTAKHGHCLTGHHASCRRVLSDGHECSCECHQEKESQ